ncbi:MAG: GTPase Era [Xanthomonadales bacterium]|jgi:GTP-binding protein Era|nr:GTPase Era [Xanthomonadales bacterium]
MTYRCGRIALLGRPNVGKSTLLNALVEANVAITSHRPQTTRHTVLGVRTLPDAQLIFVDTPGLHRQVRRGLNRRINATARRAVEAVDLILLLVRAGRWEEDDEYAEQVALQSDTPVIVVVNQVDRIVPRAKLLPWLSTVNARWQGERAAQVKRVMLVSAQTGEGLPDLLRVAAALLPEAEAQFESDALTDRDERFFAAEFIREQLMRQLGDELPYATTVTIDQFVEDDGRRRIEATIWVERTSQKAIVIGAGGAQLKEIGTRARLKLQKLFESPVHLGLWVKVKEDWADSEQALDRFGYT